MTPTGGSPAAAPDSNDSGPNPTPQSPRGPAINTLKDDTPNMPYAPLTRIHANDTTETLTMATSIVTKSGILPLLNATPTTKTGTGRPARLPQYTLLAVLATIFELAWRGAHFSWANVTQALWFRYTEAQMSSIGLTNWRHPDRLRQLQPAQPGANVTATELNKAGRAWHAEVNRLWAFADRALAPIDDTALSAKKRHREGLYQAAHANDPTLQAKRTLQMDAVNALIRASLVHANETHSPNVHPTDVLAGLLKHHKGDIGVDEHNIVVG